MKEEKDTNVEHSVSDEHQIRVEKVDAMRAAGVEPWPLFKPVNATCKDVIDEFAEDTQSREYHVSGRIMSMREHGKTIFAHIQDRSGRLQVYIRKDVIGDEQFQQLQKWYDVGDIIWCVGPSFRTKMGEVTLKVQQVCMLSKCLYPLPDKFHGLADVEIKYRQRYLDLISDPESVARFKKRSAIIQVMRNYFDAHGFMEVETPMLHPIPGGAVARPFATHHNALDMELYLRIAPELYLKRLIVGGLERVYEINRSFRNEGISTRHNPEFTMLEFYMANQDYIFAMGFVEKMLARIAMEVTGSLEVPYGDHKLNFDPPFARLSIKDAIMQYLQCSADDLAEKNIDKTLAQHNVKLKDKEASWGQKLYALFEEKVEFRLIQPTFITDFPVEVSPLAKRNPDKPGFVNRFELFIGGVELCNCFNELNDPFDQAERFHEQAKARSKGDQEAHYYDADYVHALEYGLSPTVGCGIGIDRLAMFITNTTSIKDVILFPTLKRKDS